MAEVSDDADRALELAEHITSRMPLYYAKRLRLFALVETRGEVSGVL